ncbi:MAG: alanine--tRNA ligase, partial [Proteobacteria bacterium]|nr:alanine--tRNA ligase [Pseudomonadota bacterium]
PVVPRNDPTLLFANAGMNQFKDVFLGNEVRSYKRATSVQKCIRAGGKHNDLDEVGKDGRHLTFFEMLGNWSFGDYFKKEALRWAWVFLTEQLGLDPKHLYVSVYKDDDEAYDIWHNEIGLEDFRIARFGDIEKGDEENFWSMGPVGACGPCSEIYIDKEPEKEMLWGKDFPENRYLELWNVVFMQFERSESGKLTRLPMCSVDTGMGMERILGILQNVDSVYETDLFTRILETTASLLGKKMTQSEILASEDATAYQVIADHIRTLTFAVSEGQPFSNDGRGYVLRRILRRAVRYGRKLGFRAPFLCNVSQAVVDTFSKAYPEIALVAKQTQDVIRIEEERFFATLDRGIARFEEVAAKAKNNTVDGRDAFVLYDTYGFPFDLTQIMAEERGMVVDENGFKKALEEQRQRSSEKAKFCVTDNTPWTILVEGATSTFCGYTNDAMESDVLRYRQCGDICAIILRKTPFYAEGGGEVGDQGTIAAKGSDLVFDVKDTMRCEGGIVHVCEIREGFITPEVMKGEFVATVDPEFRMAVSCNHTCTHLLQAALRSLISMDIHQAGSFVGHDRFRFDFTFNRAVTHEEIAMVEKRVNQVISEAHPVVKHADVPIEKARTMGAMAIFGEKYGDKVRVIEVPGVSTEFCGGIHVDNTRDIQTFRVVSESACSAGIRRIECVTRRSAMALYAQERETVAESARILHCSNDDVVARIEKLNETKISLEKQIEQLKLRIALAEVAGIMATRKDSANGISVYASRLNITDRKDLLTYGDLVRDKMHNGVALLGAVIDGKPALMCVASADAVKAGIHCGKLVGACAAVVGGKGGGKPNSAQAGGTDCDKLDAAIAKIYELVG